DIVLVASDNCYVLLNDGFGQFSQGATFTLPQTQYSKVVIADFDADGDMDLAFASISTSTPGSHVYINTGGLTFTQGAQLGVGVLDMEVGDVNGDGLPDIVTGYRNGGCNVF